MFNKKPKMILFDVGGTLFNDGKCIPAKGFRALLEVAENSEVTTAEKLEQRWDIFFGETAEIRAKSGAKLDMPLSSVLKYAAMQEGLKINIPITEQEEIFDRFNSTRTVIDGVTELLQTLQKLQIRTAVISNNMMSGESLSLAIKRWIPESAFEFCLTSADVLYTKPCKEIFACALNYAGLSPDECWYCGDSETADVAGSINTGMKPILLDVKSDVPFTYRTDKTNHNYLIVKHWNKLTEHINNIK